MQLSGYADMQACGYMARRRTAIGHTPLQFLVVWHLEVGSYFHNQSLRIVGVEAFGNHGGSWDIRIVLNSWGLSFVSRMCFPWSSLMFRECSVVSRWRDISPGLHLARANYPPPHLPPFLLERIVIALFFFLLLCFPQAPSKERWVNLASSTGKNPLSVSQVHAASLAALPATSVGIGLLSPLKCFFQLSIMFILFKPGTSRSFIYFVPKYFL